MIATISLSGTLSNLREYDPFDSLCSLRACVWGGVRDQASVTTDPNTRYCANLGHKQDDESGLIYMRARFYDSGTGRFITEDPAMDGTNWFVYCNNDPVNFVDRDGQLTEAERELIGSFVFAIGFLGATLGLVFPDPRSAWAEMVIGRSLTGLFIRSLMRNIVNDLNNVLSGLCKPDYLRGTLSSTWMKTLEEKSRQSLKRFGGRAVVAILSYMEMIIGVGIYMGVFEP